MFILRFIKNTYKKYGFKNKVYLIKDLKNEEIIKIKDEKKIKKISWILFSMKDNKEYYINVKYNLKEFFEFYDSKKTDDILNLFDKLKKQKEDIEKNTSLMIFLEVDSLEEVNDELKKHIFTIEEDEYFFKKYVIIYTKKSIGNLNDKKCDLKEIIEEEGMIENYQKNYYFDECYFLAIQLFIKMPFIIYSSKEEEYKTIDSELKTRIKDENLENFNEILEKNLSNIEKLEVSKNNYLNTLDEILEKFKEI